MIEVEEHAGRGAVSAAGIMRAKSVRTALSFIVSEKRGDAEKSYD